MFSGGLDSIAAVKVLQEQGIDVIGLNFSSNFFSKEKAEAGAKQLGIKLVNVDLTKGKQFKKYLNVVKKPKHGHGSAINPCIDCKIFMLKTAKSLMKRFKADFIATGEVLNERPMSQTKHALNIIEKESGLKGKLLRPLSARLLPQTDIEQKRIVDRGRLLKISGRSRKPQMKIAQDCGLDYPSPSGGCILCEKAFESKLRDLFKQKKRIRARDIETLKFGRHFRVGRNKIIVGRNEKENNVLLKLKNKSDVILEAVGVAGPITLLQNKASRSAIEVAAGVTARYCDSKKHFVTIRYRKGKFIEVSKLDDKSIDKIRI